MQRLKLEDSPVQQLQCPEEGHGVVHVEDAVGVPYPQGAVTWCDRLKHLLKTVQAWRRDNGAG